MAAGDGFGDKSGLFYGSLTEELIRSSPNVFRVTGSLGKRRRLLGCVSTNSSTLLNNMGMYSVQRIVRTLEEVMC